MSRQQTLNIACALLLLLLIAGCGCKTDVYCACPEMIQGNGSLEDGSRIMWMPCNCSEYNPDQKIVGKCTFDLE